MGIFLWVLLFSTVRWRCSLRDSSYISPISCISKELPMLRVDRVPSSFLKCFRFSSRQRGPPSSDIAAEIRECVCSFPYLQAGNKRKTAVKSKHSHYKDCLFASNKKSRVPTAAFLLPILARAFNKTNSIKEMITFSVCFAPVIIVL